MTAPAMVKAFRGAVNVVGLPPNTVQYQLRHGGASDDFLQRRRSLDDLALRMRHVTMASVRRYTKAAQVQKLMQSLTPSMRADAEQNARALGVLVSGRVTPSLPG